MSRNLSGEFCGAKLIIKKLDITKSYIQMV